MTETTEQIALERIIRKYITAAHILHHHGVLDAYGHLSFRDPNDPKFFYMAQFIAPATISRPEDLIRYYVEVSKRRRHMR